MGYKIGGGGLLQLYDERNGQYTDEEKKIMNSSDYIGLICYKYCKDRTKLIFHFPSTNIHNAKYCEDFVDVMKNEINDVNVAPEKARYLLTHSKHNDKSKFFISLGYSAYNCYSLMYDIRRGTNLDSLKFVGFSPFGCLKCSADTIIKGKKITTIWEIEKNLGLRLITAIPGGDKR